MIVALVLAAATATVPVAAPPAFPDAVTQHTMTLDGRQLHYTARAGTITIRDDQDRPTARMFYVAYTEDGADPSKRPVTFLYNGGPGSASMWLHMGAFGPVRVIAGNGTMTGPPPYRVESNPESLLNDSDLVFVDMPNTGFGRIVGSGGPKDFFGVDEDARAFAQFIERYVTKFGRWNSPKVLYGESYGTTRSAAVGFLLQQDGISLNGIVLQSTILNFNLDWNTDYETSVIGGGDWVYVLYLPSMAATALYHHKVSSRASLQSFLAGVERFAMGEYLDALAQGDMISSGERDDVVRKMHDYIGLSEAYIREANLRVTPERFMQALLRSDSQIVGALDTRYTNFTPDATALEPGWDPTESAIFAPYTTAINDYLRITLGYNPPIPYLIFVPRALIREAGGWDFKHDGQPTTNVAVDLAKTMAMNPSLRIFSANGYFDFATPYLATIYTLHHLNLSSSLLRNISYGFYPAGHMMYLDPPVFANYKADLDRWYAQLK